METKNKKPFKVTKKGKKPFKKDHRPEFFKAPCDDVYVERLDSIGTVKFWAGASIVSLNFMVNGENVSFPNPYPIPTIMKGVERRTKEKLFPVLKTKSTANFNKAMSRAGNLAIGGEEKSKEAPEQAALKQYQENKDRAKKQAA